MSLKSNTEYVLFQEDKGLFSVHIVTCVHERRLGVGLGGTGVQSCDRGEGVLLTIFRVVTLLFDFQNNSRPFLLEPPNRSLRYAVPPS